VGFDMVVICREDLDEPLAYELTRDVLEAFPQMPAASTGLEEAPATPLPLHSGAARYYREWELIR